MDPLGSVPRELRFESAAYRRLPVDPPRRVEFAQAGPRGVHFLVEGRCELVS